MRVRHRLGIVRKMAVPVVFVMPVRVLVLYDFMCMEILVTFA